MSKKVVSTDKAPAAIGPYSQAIDIGQIVFTSGQLPVDSKGELVSEIKAATKCCLENVSAVAQAAGTSIANTIKTTVFLTDLANFAAMNEVYATFFEGAPPARSCVQVAALPKGAIIEIEAIVGK